MSCCSCGCCSDCCPVVVPVTITNNTYQIDDLEVESTVEDLDPVDSTKKRVTFQVVDDSGNPVTGTYFRIRMWFIDSSTPSDTRSAVVPDDPGLADFERITDSDGNLVFVVEYTGSSRTWYLASDFGFGVHVTPAITIGT